MLYVGLGILYVFLMIFFGVRSIRNGHWMMFMLGFVVPFLWIIGGVLPPKGMSRVDAMYVQRDRSS